MLIMVKNTFQDNGKDPLDIMFGGFFLSPETDYTCSILLTTIYWSKTLISLIFSFSYLSFINCYLKYDILQGVSLRYLTTTKIILFRTPSNTCLLCSSCLLYFRLLCVVFPISLKALRQVKWCNRIIHLTLESSTDSQS